MSQSLLIFFPSSSGRSPPGPPQTKEQLTVLLLKLMVLYSTRVTARVLVSPQDCRDCAERHSKPSDDGTYGCVILEALGYLCNLNVLQALFHADKDADKKKNWALSRISAVTFTWIRDEIYSQWFMFTKLVVYLKFK